MLDESLKRQLGDYLHRMTAAVELTAALDDSPASADLRALLAELVALSPKLTLREDPPGAEPGVRRPSFAIGRVGEPPRIRFAGLPMGHEFTSLVLALLHTGGHPPKAAPATLDAIRALPGDLVFETYVSLTCQNCPDVVQALNLMAALNPRVRHTMIDGALFQGEVDSRQIMAVPTVFLNGRPFGQGRMSAEEIVAKLDTGAQDRAAAELAAKAPYDVLIVGGGPAGASAAIYAARKGLRTGIVTERFGGQVLDTLGISNFISVAYTEGPKLAAALEAHVEAYGVDVMRWQRASALVPAGRLGGYHGVRLESGAALQARAVILATGARWRELGVPGEAEYRTRGVAYCPHCDGPLFKGKRVAVVGGGNSGVEAAIDLAGVVAHVTLIEYDPQLRADAVLQNKLRSLTNVTIVTHAQTTEILGDGQKVEALVYKDRSSGEIRRVALAGVFVQIGLLPNTDWLRGTVALSSRGEIQVDDRGATNLPGVFAAGDATTVPFKQIVIALGEGAKACLGAFDYLIRVPAPAEREAAPAAA